MWLFYLIILLPCCKGSFLDYFWADKQSTQASAADTNSFPAVLYEVSDSDDRFLKEASTLVGLKLSELDMCHHRVILTLKKSCHELNSEQIGKLAVMLLNCQSGSEGRTMFECTDNMSLKQCTSNMDADTWNAYHLITNRAKAVCANVRQEQFRGLTELTVNKLMNTAHEQIHMMNKLSDEQKKLHDMTHSAIDVLSDKNIKLIDQQHELMEFADQHRQQIEDNFLELIKERGLIRSGQQEVAGLLGDLRAKLDEGLKQIDLQSKRSRINHVSLLNDLENLHVTTDVISTKIEKTTNHILQQHQLSMEQLERINNTIFGLAKLMNNLQSDFDRKLTWISTKIGGNGDALNQLQIIMIHVVYLLMGMLCLAFVGADKFTRIFFLMAVPSNLVASLYNFYGQDIASFTAIVFAVLTVYVVAQFFRKVDRKVSRKASRKEAAEKQKEIEKVVEGNVDTQVQKSEPPPPHKKTYTATPKVKQNIIIHEITRDADDTDNDEIMNFSTSSANNNSSQNNSQQQRFLTPIPKRLLNESFGSGPGTPGRSGTPFSVTLVGRVQCSGYTLKGEQCRNAAVAGEEFCRMHNRQSVRR